MDKLKTEKIYMRINADLKEAINEVAKAENRSLSNLLETLIADKVNEFQQNKIRKTELLCEERTKYNLDHYDNYVKKVILIEPRKFNGDRINSIKGDGNKLRNFLKDKEISLVDFKRKMELREYYFKKLFYGNGKVNEELAEKIEKELGIDKSYWK